MVNASHTPRPLPSWKSLWFRPQWGVCLGGMLMAMLTSGCPALGYRLGAALPADIRSIGLAPCANRTREHDLEPIVTQAILRLLQQYGNVRVIDPDKADARLEVTLTHFEQQPLLYGRDDPLRGREFRIRGTAHVLLRRRVSGEELVERTLVGETTFVAPGDLITPKAEALPRLAEDLARRIVDAIVEAW